MWRRGVVLAVLALLTAKGDCASYSGNFCPVGLENLRVSDSSLTESSFDSTKSKFAFAGRLNNAYVAGLNDGAWIPATAEGSYVEIALDFPVTLTAVATQGEARFGAYTRSYQIQYKAATGDSSFQFYRENNTTVTFAGNTDATSTVTRNISFPFVAQVIRILPTDWLNRGTANAKPALRLELYSTCLWAQDFRDEQGKGMVGGTNGTSNFTNVDWVVGNPDNNQPGLFQVNNDGLYYFLQVRNTGSSFRVFRKASPMFTSMYKSIDVIYYASSRGTFTTAQGTLNVTYNFNFNTSNNDLFGPALSGQLATIPAAVLRYNLTDAVLRDTFESKLRFRINDSPNACSYYLYYVWVTGTMYDCTKDVGTFLNGTVCQRCDGVTGFQDTLPSTTSCKPITNCPAGQYEIGAPTRTSQRNCTNCNPGTFRLASDSNVACRSVSTCGVGQYLSTPPTLTSNSVCTACPDGKFSTALNHLNPNSCESWRKCNPGEYVSVEGTASTDRVCTPCTMCSAGSYLSGGCTGLTNSACTLCELGKFTLGLNLNTSCEAWRTCTSSEFEASGGTRTSNRVCQTCSPCNAGEYKFGGCIDDQDTQCALCATNKLDCLPTIAYLSGECTPTSGPVCVECPKSCGSCSGPTACDSCPVNKLLRTNGECEDRCAYYEYPLPSRTDARCARCDLTCHECKDAGPNRCNSCLNPVMAPDYAGDDPSIWRFMVSSEGTCVKDCGAGFFKDNSTGLCKLAKTCASYQYVVSEPSGFNDRVCRNYTVCLPGENQVVAPTPTTDRICEKCLPGTYDEPAYNASIPCLSCPTGKTDHDSNPLTACITCPAGTYVPMGSFGPCSNFRCVAGRTDIDSDPTTPCFLCAPGTYSGGGTFGACTQCEAGKYDRDNSPATPCEACPTSFYQPQKGMISCTACAPPCADNEWQVANCTSTSNRVCSLCTVCTGSTSKNCTETSDAVCAGSPQGSSGGGGGGNIPVIAGAAGGGAFVVLLIICCCVCKRKNNKKRKDPAYFGRARDPHNSSSMELIRRSSNATDLRMFEGGRQGGMNEPDYAEKKPVYLLLKDMQNDPSKALYSQPEESSVDEIVIAGGAGSNAYASINNGPGKPGYETVADGKGAKAVVYDSVKEEGIPRAGNNSLYADVDKELGGTIEKPESGAVMANNPAVMNLYTQVDKKRANTGKKEVEALDPNVVYSIPDKNKTSKKDDPILYGNLDKDGNLDDRATQSLYAGLSFGHTESDYETVVKGNKPEATIYSTVDHDATAHRAAATNAAQTGHMYGNLDKIPSPDSLYANPNEVKPSSSPRLPPRNSPQPRRATMRDQDATLLAAVHTSLNKSAAEAMVTNQSAPGDSGVYLLRNNPKSPDVLVITTRSNGKNHHIQLQKTDAGYRNMTGITFQSLTEALEHYKRTPEGDADVITRRIDPL